MTLFSDPAAWEGVPLTTLSALEREAEGYERVGYDVPLANGCWKCIGCGVILPRDRGWNQVLGVRHANPRGLLEMLFSDPAVVEAVADEIGPLMDIRCGQCAGTGSDLRSNLDCTPCKATGYRQDAAWKVEAVREAAGKILAAAVAALPRDALIEKATAHFMDADDHLSRESVCRGRAVRLLVDLGLIEEEDE